MRSRFCCSRQLMKFDLRSQMCGPRMSLLMIQLDWKAWTRRSYLVACNRPGTADSISYSPGTSHIAAADHSGLAISVITTINLLFGSHVMVPETGIIMNNEMNGMPSQRALKPQNRLTFPQTSPFQAHQTHSDTSPLSPTMFVLENGLCPLSHPRSSNVPMASSF